jgi:hypothetical protein
MYDKFFIIIIVVIIAFAATIAGTTTVIGQNQTLNLTALLTPDTNNDTTTTTTTLANTTAAANNMTTTATNTTVNTTAANNMTIEDAKELYLSVWNQTEFNATFSTFVEPFSAAGYGVYEARNNTFAPGETIVLYVEPVGFGHEQVIEEGDVNNNNSNTMLYLMNMTADYGIAAANGTELQLIEDVEVLRNITSHRPNTEMFLTLTITPDVQPLPIGSYVITYSANDEVSGERFQLKKDIIIAEKER